MPITASDEVHDQPLLTKGNLLSSYKAPVWACQRDTDYGNSQTYKIKNEDVLKTVKEENLRFTEKIVKQELLFTGQVLRGSRGNYALLILEGKESVTMTKKDLDMWCIPMKPAKRHMKT